MKFMHLFNAPLLVLPLALAAITAKAASLGTEFTYQGLLATNGSPVNGAYEMKFTLFQQGNPTPGPSNTLSNVPVTLGVFTTKLDFGAGVFDGTAYELEIAVRPQGSGGSYATLQPRQALTATPNATHARTVSSVPDSALSSNVPLLNGSPVFTTAVSVTMLRVAEANGAGLLKFGPTDDCTIGVTPQGPTGLLLRDPKGVRILSPNPAFSPTLRFGPTDDCSIGIDPAFPGLVERDPIGFRLMGLNNQGCRLIFGPTMDCTVEVNPAGPQGLLLRDPSGIRVLPPGTALPRLLFGPTDDCSIGIDPQLTGLLLRDPRGVRIASAAPGATPQLLFGPTDDCSIGIDPTGQIPGLIERDPIGFRLLGPNNQGCRLIFGPTMNCTVEVNPAGPAGLLLRDPSGIRVLPPGTALPRLLFGPTDDCSIGIDPAFPGLVERDPIGFRLLGLNNQGCRLIFGPTMNCTVEVDPAGPAGLLLRDPSGIRILSPSPTAPPTLRFGPTDDCSIGIDPAMVGLRLRDPGGLRIAPASANTLATLRFGPTDDCSIGIDPAFPGLVERDVVGLRLLGQNSQGGRLIFGPTMNCTIEIQPPGSNSIAGLLLRDPKGIRLFNPSPGGTNTILFGPTDDCRIVADPTSGLRFSDPRGFTFGSQVAVNGPVFAQAFVQTSSRRFKNDVKPIEQPLEKISKLQGVRFTWNEEKGGQKDVGFIAEDVAKVLPELVSWEADGQDARGVNYDHLVAVAIEGIKAQQTQIATLERDKAELKQSVETMQARLDQLSQKLEAMAAR